MKRFELLLGVMIFTGIFLSACGSNDSTQSGAQTETVPRQHDHQQMMQKMNLGEDTRVPLNPGPMQARHQLMNMRSHVVAVQAILAHLAREEYDSAATVAHTQLGLTEEMKMMCSAFGNEDFQRLGFEFHEQADRMAEVFKTRDQNRSLQALALTMNSCVTCHATFRQ